LGTTRHYTPHLVLVNTIHMLIGYLSLLLYQQIYSFLYNDTMCPKYFFQRDFTV
jgi:hypothetical protein